MADIFDLVPARETVEIAGISQEVRAVALGEALQIMARFPALGGLLTGNQKVTFAELLSSGAVPAIIAAGCDKFGDEKAETHIASLDADTQTSVLIPILRLTMPRGVVPFLTSVAQFVTVLSPSAPPTREEIIERMVRKSSPKSAPSSSLSTPDQSVAAN